MPSIKHSRAIFNIMVAILIAATLFSVSHSSITIAKAISDSNTNSFTAALIPVQATGNYSLAGPITVNDTTGACGTINVADTGIITGVSVSNLGIDHNWPGDLRVRLYSPDGTYLTLFDRPDYPNFFLGESSDLISSSPLSFSDAFSDDPETMGNTILDIEQICEDDGRCTYVANRDEDLASITNFAAFSNGTRTIQGIWQICGYDFFPAADDGTINSATLNLTYATIPTVTIAPASSQSDPAKSSPVNFTVVFSEAVTGFVTGEVTLGGSAGATTAIVSETAPNDGTTYNVAVSGMVSNGDVTASIAADVAQSVSDGINNEVSTSATIFYDPSPPRLPLTGFPRKQVTFLPFQPEDNAYTSTDLLLEIPSLNVKTSIVGVPMASDGWDVTWLNSNAGWLNGSAFPTWNGNSVITAHVWDALNQPGPFARLKELKYGDQIKVHAFGQVYTYEIRETMIVAPTNISEMLKHEEKSWITLVTCENYFEATTTYLSRRIIRAVLVRVASN